MLIIVEPAYYLDRDGLGALVLAIQGFKGGARIITHNKEIYDGVAKEKWIMKGGLLRIEGEFVDTDDQNADCNRGPDEVF